MRKSTKIKLLLAAAAAGTPALAGFLHYQNHKLDIRFTEAEDSGKDKKENIRIVQVSDLHGAVFGKNNEKLLDRLTALKPDLIAVTGDIIFGYAPEMGKAADFLEEALKLAPVAFVTGNHEEKYTGKVLNTMLKLFSEMGVDVLNNERISVEKNGHEIIVTGVSDRNLKCANVVKPQEGKYNVLLAHEPHFRELYGDLGYDMVLTGHAHGGQIRLPKIGALVAPGQGFLPSYTEGCYTEGKTTVHISRGLGRSIFPFRIFNHPEICVYDINS